MGLLGLGGVLFFISILVSTGSVYVKALDGLDGTTMAMIGLLLINGIWSFRRLPDVVSFGTTVVICLSFIYTFEGIYKCLFFGWLNDPEELREMLLQIAMASAVVLPIGNKNLKLTRTVWAFFALYVVFMFIWWITGYPQIFEDEENRVIFWGSERIIVSVDQVYYWNRLTKLWLFLAFFFAVKK